MKRREHDTRPKPRAVFADAPLFFFETSFTPYRIQHVLRLSGSAILGRIEDRKMLTDDLAGSITLDTLRARVPRDVETPFVEQVDGVVRDGVDELVKARFRLTQPLLCAVTRREVARDLAVAAQRARLSSLAGLPAAMSSSVKNLEKW